MVLSQWSIISTSLWVQNSFITQEEPLYPSNNHALFPLTSSLWKPRICSLALWILFWIFHMKRIIQHITFCASLLLLMMFSRFIDVVACICSSFLFMAESPVVCIYHSLFIPWSADRHLGRFYLLPIANSAAMNICEHICLSSSFLFFWIYN